MKKTLAATALAMVVAAPAFAQSYDPDLVTGNIGNINVAPLITYDGTNSAAANISAQVTPWVTPGTNIYRGERSFARVAPVDVAPGMPLQPSNAVFDGHGQLIGADPDANVRLELLKDHDTIQ